MYYHKNITIGNYTRKVFFKFTLKAFFFIPDVQSKFRSLRQFNLLISDCFPIFNLGLSPIVAIPGLLLFVYGASLSFCVRGGPCPRLYRVIAILTFEYFIHCNGAALLNSLLRSAFGMRYW